MELKSQETISFSGGVGRPGNDIIYEHIVYNGKYYTIMKIKFNEEILKCIIDTDDFDKIRDFSWHYIANSYVSHGLMVNGKKKELYLHNYIMGLIDFPGKGAKESVDHINRIGLDNRKENLRIITQSAQNINQKQKERRIELPTNSGITVDDIPKHIWYIKANGSHGDRFGIDLKTENIKWKTTSAKNVSLKDKLKAAKEQLLVYYQMYPYLDPHNEDKNKEIKQLVASYENIIRIENNSSSHN